MMSDLNKLNKSMKAVVFFFKVLLDFLAYINTRSDFPVDIFQIIFLLLTVRCSFAYHNLSWKGRNSGDG